MSPQPIQWQMTGSAWPDRFGENLAAWSASQKALRIQTLSLFSGAGGLDVGFAQAGFHAVQMVEFDSRFIPTLESNCSEGKILAGATPVCQDVRKYEPPTALEVDFIIGGPPCQTFSAAGRRAGGVLGTTDQRGQLFEAYVELLKQLKPRAFLFENVYGITGANGGRDWERIRTAFQTAGYDVYHRILDSADYGVPQHRERMFIVGVEQSLRTAYRFPCPTHGLDSPNHLPYYTAAQAISGASISAHELGATVNGRYGGLLSEVPPGLNYSYFTEKLGHPRPVFAWRSKFSDFLYKADPDRPVRTIKAQGGQYTGPFHWEDRPFGLAELKRLQTFPDAYRIVGGRSTIIHQIGNSVPPQLARILAASILSQIFGARLPFELPLLEPDALLGFRTRKRQLTEHYAAKAEQAIASLKTQPAAKPARRSIYNADLTDTFQWLRSPRGKLRTTFTPSKAKWCFVVGDSDCEQDRAAFTISVRPAGDGWHIPSAEVVLAAARLSSEMFTGVWKAFEMELQRANLKADLVQLCGYYQYVPAITCCMEIQSRSARWRALARVVSGHGVREPLPVKDAASRWSIDAGEVWSFAEFLRTLGFEVRNSSTNPQIPSGHILIPYCFPTLTHKSVQLHKDLCV